jgi:plastocyanin
MLKRKSATLALRRRSKIMKRLNAVLRPTFWLATMFAIVFLSQAQSRDRRTTITTHKEHAAGAIHIVDQNGRPAVSGVPSATSQIFDVAVGQGGFVFVPDTLNISVGDTVRWTWASNNHSVTSGTPCTIDGQFCSPDDTNCQAGVLSNTGFVYQHTFAQPGAYSYFCVAHCGLGMTGVINVASATPTPTPNGITLSAHGRRVQGRHTVDLSWNGATSANTDIYRDGVVIATVPNNGTYTDSIGVRGGNVRYVYKVCDAGTQNCSNEVTVRFGAPPL